MRHPARGVEAAAGPVASSVLRSTSSRDGLVPLVVVCVPPESDAAARLHRLIPDGTILAADDLPQLVELTSRLGPDLIVVDIGLLAPDPIEGLADIRRAGSARTIVVGSCADSFLRASLLRAGADDCLTSPYLNEELAARMEAVLRRTAHPSPGRGDALMAAGPIEVDLRGHVVRVDGRVVALTAREFELLAYLVSQPGIALTREELLLRVWGYSFYGADTVTVHVRRLREKIEPDPSQPRWIQTVWGIGYRFCPPEPNGAAGS